MSVAGGVDVVSLDEAPVWRRTAAALVDRVPVFGLWLLATWAIVALDLEPPDIPNWNFIDRVVDYIQARPGRSLLAVVVLFAIEIGWPMLFTPFLGASPGKRLLGLEVVDRSGRRARPGRVLAWLAARLPSAYLAGAGLWWSIVDPERRTLHDRAAGIWVVVRPRLPRA
ncbi:MAG: RDD family protein [Myxococcota bacterium]